MYIKINAYREALLEMLRISKTIVRAKGAYLQDCDGNVYTDCLSQYGAVPFGHNPEFILDAIKEYARMESPCMLQPMYCTEAIALANRLCNLVGPRYKYCTFTNSGTETVEAAIKLARLKSGKKPILSLHRSFHGKTFASLSSTSSQRHKDPLITDDQYHTVAPDNELATIRALLRTERYAAILIEPVQGEGGMHAFSNAYLNELTALAQQYKTLVIFDEIQTGLGRCGEIAIAQTLNHQPDIILFSKALGGGVLPIGAVVYRQSAYSRSFDKKHSSTFAGNGLAACVGNAVLGELTRNDSRLLEHVNKLSRHIEIGLKNIATAYPDIFSFCGRGLMWSLTVSGNHSASNILINYLQNSGGLAYLICSYLMNNRKLYTMPLLSEPCAIRYEPPLNSTIEQADQFIDAILQVCRLIHDGRFDMLFAHLIGIDTRLLAPLEKKYPLSSPELKISRLSTHQTLPKGKKFAFFIHSTSIEEFCSNLPLAIQREYPISAQRELAQYFIDSGRIDYSPELAYAFTVKGKHTESDGIFIFSPMRSEDMLKLSPKEKRRLMDEYIDVAKREGAEIMGLGAYTSVITRGGELIHNRPDDLFITTGNSMTAMATLETLMKLIPIEQAPAMKAMIIGARGSVGRLITLGMSHYFGNIYLVGREGSENVMLESILDDLFRLSRHSNDPILKDSILDKIRRYIDREGIPHADRYHDPSFKIQMQALGLFPCVAEARYMQDMDCIVSSTSEGKPFLQSHFKQDAIIFDVARPFDFIDTQTSGKIFEGGLVNQPEAVFYSDSNLIGTPTGVNLACLSETIVLALDSVCGDYSIGKKIAYEEAKHIHVLAEKHGFTPYSYR